MGEQATADCSYDNGLASDDASLRAGLRQVSDSQRSAIRPSNVLGSWSQGHNHRKPHALTDKPAETLQSID